jgi:hypothetical protein
MADLNGYLLESPRALTAPVNSQRLAQRDNLLRRTDAHTPGMPIFFAAIGMATRTPRGDGCIFNIRCCTIFV